MQKSMPVISCTDRATDIGAVIENGGFGISCHSNDVESFSDAVVAMLDADTDTLGENGAKYLLENYTVAKSADIILGKCNEVKK